MARTLKVPDVMTREVHTVERNDRALARAAADLQDVAAAAGRQLP